METIERHDADLEVYTDGSAVDATTNGGAGVVVYTRRRSPDDTVSRRESHASSTAAGRFCSSYRAEMTALEDGLQYIYDRPRLDCKKIVILTDSQSALLTLASGPAGAQNRSAERIWQLLLDIRAKHDCELVLQWIPGHCGVPGNDRADELARAGTDKDQQTIPLDLTTANAVLRRFIRGQVKSKWTTSTDSTDRYSRILIRPPRDVLQPPLKRAPRTRAEERTLAQLRADKCPLTMAYRHKIKVADTAQCRFCSAALESVDHLFFECPHFNSLRDEVGLLHRHQLKFEESRILTYLDRMGL